MLNIFEEAAEVLMKGGHCKGFLRDDDGQHCAIGALHEAEVMLNGRPYTHEAANKAAELIAQKCGLDDPQQIPGHPDIHPLARWNDMPERTAEDVILLFKELAHDA